MSISSAVARLADLAAAQAATPELRDALAEIARMPEHVQQARLDLWEEACNAQRGAMDEVAGAIYALGTENLYGEIEPETTRRLYGEAVALLRGAGIDVPDEEVDLGDW